jgi:hypothetical protein
MRGDRKERVMAKVEPYHTNSPEYPPEHRNVYYDYSNCPDGQRIKAEHRESGRGGRVRCDKCKGLD